MGDDSCQTRDPYTLPSSEDRRLPDVTRGRSYSSPDIILTFGLLLSLVLTVTQTSSLPKSDIDPE